MFLQIPMWELNTQNIKQSLQSHCNNGDIFIRGWNKRHHIGKGKLILEETPDLLLTCS